MKTLVTNLAKTATISSLYETISYPAANVVDRFLDVPFISVVDTDTLSIDLGSNQSLDCVFIAGCNAATVDLVVKNATLADVYTGTETISDDVIVVYTGSVTGRYITIEGTAVGSLYFKIKGVGVGVATDLGKRSFQSELPIINDTIVTTSATGQTMANVAPTRKLRNIQIPVIRKDDGIARVNTIRIALDSISIGIPTYWDLNDGGSDFEAPIYGIMPEVYGLSFDRDTYLFSIKIAEAR